MHVVKSWLDLDILEQRHAKYSKNEHDKEEEKADINQGWEGHHQGE